MSKPGATLRVNPLVLNLGERLNRKLHDTVLPRALSKVGKVAIAAIRVKLPDGDKPNASGLPASRTKQTGFEGKWNRRTDHAARFPTKLKDNVRQKIAASDKTGLLQLVGVTSRAKHVNFDHGDKAKTTGRRHVLWDATGRRVMTPEFRKQTQDIAAIVKLEVTAQAQAIVVSEIKAALASGELK